MRRQQSRDVVWVNVPVDQAAVFYLPGTHGGWFISLLYDHGYGGLEVPIPELRKLLEGSRGEVILARRLTMEEASKFERMRVASDGEAHAKLTTEEEKQFRRPARSRRGGA